MSDEEIHAPGWSAIDMAVGRIYPGQTPHQFASKTPYELDARSPLPAITVWENRLPPSWHYVTYGLTELFDKTSNVPDVSGFGFELVMRVPKAEGEEMPPIWPLRLLQTLGHYVLDQRQGFDSGHLIGLESPLTTAEGAPGDPPAPETKLDSILAIPDPLLGKIDTPHGAVLFLQLVGLHADERKAFESMDLEQKVGAMADLDPAGLTDPARESWLEHEEKVKVLRRYQFKIGM